MIMKEHPIPGPMPPINAAQQSKSKPKLGHWNGRLVVFLRIMAVLWIVQGLMLWQGLLLHQPSPLTTLDFADAAGLVAFAVLDLIAATGLWLPATWGAVLWVGLCTAQIFTGFEHAVLPFNSFGLPLVDVLLLVAYVGLTFQAARERLTL